MKVIIKFNTELKRVFRAGDEWRVPVLGVTYLHVCPDGKGIGRETLGILKRMAERMELACAVYYADSKTIEFFKACNWHVREKVNGKYLVTSEQIDINESLTERW